MARFHFPLPPPTLPSQNRQGWIQFLDLWFLGPTPLRLTYKPSFGGGPIPLSTRYVPSVGGLYAIMVYDATFGPLPYRLIYMGEAQNLAERLCGSHEKYESWIRAAGGSQLYVGFHFIEQESARQTTERRLIEYYGPECNKTFNHNALALRALSSLYSYKPDWTFES